MKFSNNAQAALAQSDTRSVAIAMTPELKEKYSRVAAEVVAMLKARTESPIEGYMVLQFVVHSFEAAYGIRGGVIVENQDGSQ